MDDLDAFFGEGAPASEPQPEAQQAPEPTAAPEPVATEAPPPQTDDDEPPAAQPGERAVPLAALEAERARRKDWKSQAIRHEEQAKAAAEEARQLREQLAAATKAAAVPPKPAEPTAPRERMPNPVEDPEGYDAFQQRRLFNERLNMSEQMLRSQHDDVDAVMAVFQDAVKQNPALGAELTRQPHPYKWAYEQAKRLQAMQEIGPDPAAYRSKLEQEFRAKWEAERAEAPAPAPAPRLPTSLAASRSAAPRSPAAPISDGFEAAYGNK